MYISYIYISVMNFNLIKEEVDGNKCLKHSADTCVKIRELRVK